MVLAVFIPNQRARRICTRMDSGFERGILTSNPAKIGPYSREVGFSKNDGYLVE
jgi:hypothetical protein